MKKSEITLKNMQIKSKNKLCILASCLADIEAECGIKQVRIALDNVFICPEISLDENDYNSPMEKLLVEIIKIED